MTSLADAELELLDDVGYFLEPVDVFVNNVRVMSNHQKSSPFEEDHFIRPADEYEGA